MKRRKQPAETAARKPRYRFSKEDCQRGYQAALEKCSEDWNLAAWFFRHVPGHYRAKRP